MFRASMPLFLGCTATSPTKVTAIFFSSPQLGSVPTADVQHRRSTRLPPLLQVTLRMKNMHVHCI